MQPPQPRAVDEGFLLRLTAALADQDPAVTLVLDDLHMLREPEALKELDFVLRNAGAGLRLVVTSRMDPLLPLHRYRLAGQLAEIRASDLAFSAAEASLLLAEHGGTLTADRWSPDPADRGLGSRASPGRDVPGRPSRPGPVRQGADGRGQRPDQLPGRRGAQRPPPEVREVLLSTSILEHIKPMPPWT